jgi:hypothetical protein
MSVHPNVRSNGVEDGEEDVRVRPRTLRGGHDPSQLGRLSGESRRERKARREADAAHDRLTVQARLAVVTARRLTTAELDDLFLRALARAKGDGHVANAAFQQVMSMALAAVTSSEDSIEGVDWSDMTPQQRATARAEIERRLAQLAIDADDSRADA